MTNPSGMVIQTPELFLQKGAQTESNIGSHILVATLFAGKGAVFGMKFDSRRNKEFQWVKAITPRVILSGWGLYSDFQKVAQYLNDAAQGITELAGEPYATLPFLSKSATSFLGNKFEVSAIPFSVDILLIDVVSREISLVDFRGNSTFLRGFGILGGYQYASLPFPENAHTLSDEEFKKFFIFPCKNAIKHLENIFGEKEFLSKKDAVKAVTETLFRFDPESKKENFIIIVYKNCQFSYFVIERKSA